MPQFDFYSFFVQIFWLSYFSCVFYLMYTKMALMHTSQAFKMREKLMSFGLISNTKTKKSFIYSKAVASFK